MIGTTARNASLDDLLAMLSVQHDNTNDAIIAAAGLEMNALAMPGTDQWFPALAAVGMGPDGPAGERGMFRITDVLEEGISEKLGIPLKYLRRMRETRLDMYCNNVNGWLQGNLNEDVGPDPRNFMLRTFTDPDSPIGIGRALLSDTYRIVDNLDVVTAAIAGIRAAGADAYIEKAQLSDRKMTVDVVCEQIGVNAAELLRDYRDPFAHDGIDRAAGWTLERARRIAAHENGGYEPGTEPMLWSGFTFSNSEIGDGAFSITPRVVFSICRNGLKLSRDMLRKVHVGARLDEGIVWSQQTQALNAQLVTSMVSDAVSSWLDIDFVRKQAEWLAGNNKPVRDPAATVQLIGHQLAFTEEERNEILRHFTVGGQLNSLGVLNAITSVAQTVESPDRAGELEDAALQAFTLLAIA